MDTFAVDEISIPDLAELDRIITKAKAILARYESRNRKIIELYLKHYSHEEIACRVGISRQMVTKVINTFRLSLQAAIK